MSQRLNRWDRWLAGGMRATSVKAVVAATLSALPLSMVMAADATTTLTVDVASQSLEAALVELSRQGHLQLVIATSTLPAKKSASLRGSMPLGVAFDQLLQGTGLTYRLVGEHTIAIVKADTVKVDTVHQQSDPPQSPGVSGETGSGSLNRSDSGDQGAENNNTKGDHPVKHRSFLLRLASSLGICLPSAGPVCAQDVPAGHLEEIVVTARKTEESLQRVPVAVAVIGQEQLQNNITSDLSKVGELAPQVSMSQGGSGTGAIITVRGVSSASNDAGLDQSVAVEIDGVPISRGQVMSSSVFDLKQVQILEGPQALFFGKNSPAGVISLRSADPTNKFESYVKAGYEFEADQRFVEAAVSGPLVDTLKARVAFRGSKMDGWMHNTAGPITDFLKPTVTEPGATMGHWGPDERLYAGRLTLLWTPSDDFEAKLKFTVNSQKTNSGNSMSEPFCINGQTQPVLLGTVPLPGADCSRNRVKSVSSVAPDYTVNFPYANGGVPYFWSKYKFVALNLDKKFSALDVVSTTGYYDQTVQQMNVSDWSPYATIWFAGKEKYSLFTQEVRANTQLDGPVNFMGGVYYEHFNRPFFNAPDLFHVFNTVAQDYAITHMRSTSHGDYYSGFAQVRWNIVPTLELAAGARYSHDEKDIAITNYANTTSPTYAALRPSGQTLNSKYSDDNVSPEATLSWHPEPDQTLYGAFKTGYKAGGMSNAYLVYTSATPQNIKFNPEKARGFELGYKGITLDRRLRYDLTAYRYNYDDLQVVSYNAQTISFSIGNAASARIQGVEGTFDFLALDELSFQGNVGYNRARYEDYRNAQCYVGQTAALGCVGGVQDLSGKALLRAPNLTFSLGADYKPHLIPGWMTAASVQGTHSSSFQTASDYGPGGLQDAYWLLNASLRVGPESGTYELAVIGRNLTNSYYMLNTVGWSGAGNPNQYVGFFNRPREVVVQATARF